MKKISREHLEQFGSAGLRTLCLAYRDLSREQYESWNEKFVQAKSSLRDRDKKLDEVNELPSFGYMTIDMNSDSVFCICLKMWSFLLELMLLDL
jgi:hypothetical protein